MRHYLRFSLTLLLFMLVGGVSLAQTKVTFDATTDKGSTETSLEKDGVSLNVTSSTSNIGILNNGSEYRIYKSSKLTISSSVGNITKIEFTCTASGTTKYGPGCFTANDGTYSYKDKVGTWTGSETAVEFTASSNQVRATKIVVTVSSSSSSKTKTTTTFGTEVDNQTFTLTEGDEFPKYAATAKDASGNSVAGTVAYTSDNACVTVDANGQTAAGEGFGTAKITATFTPSDAETYEASSASYTITYKEKVAEGAIVFSGANGAFAKVGSYNSKNTTMKDVTFIDNNGKEYTFSTNGGKTGNNMQLAKTTGEIVSPEFSDFTDGYKVTVIYYHSGSNEITLSAGDLKATGAKDGEGTQAEGTGFSATLTVPSTDAFTITAGNAAYISKITIEPLSFDYVWNDTEANTIETEDNKTVKINRTVVKDEYNTICLPFTMTAEKIATAFGEGTKVYSFGIAEDNAIYFDDATEMEACKPYLLKPTETKNEIVYTGEVYGSDLITNSKDDDYSFIGTFSPVALKTDGTNLFFVAGAKLAKPESDQNKANVLKGFRAYMEVPAASANTLKVCIDGITTSINDIKTDMTISDGKVYNLNGQYVGNSMQNLTKGVYVQNGKKYVVK